MAHPREVGGLEGARQRAHDVAQEQVGVDPGHDLELGQELLPRNAFRTALAERVRRVERVARLFGEDEERKHVGFRETAARIARLQRLDHLVGVEERQPQVRVLHVEEEARPVGHLGMVVAPRRELRAAPRPDHARLEVDAGGPAVGSLEEPLDLSEERHQRPCL